MLNAFVVTLEVILWPFVFVARAIWKAIQWILFAIGEIIGYLDC